MGGGGSFECVETCLQWCFYSIGCIFSDRKDFLKQGMKRRAWFSSMEGFEVAGFSGKV
jgi:hypothetical protein